MNDDIPLIGQSPRLHQRRIEPLILNDKDGSATLTPLEDLTPLEALRMTELIFWMLTTPGNGQAIPDPQTNGRSPLLVQTMWREFIMAQGLERHFRFSGMRSDAPTAGGET